MEEKTEIGSFSKDDFEKKLKTVKNSLQSFQFKTTFIDIVKDDSELSYLLMASLFWVENEQETGYDSFVRQYIPQIFTKLLTEEHCRHWQPEVNQAIQRRNLELIRLVASMLKNNVYNSSLTPVMCGLLDPDCFFFIKNKHGNPPSYNSVTNLNVPTNNNGNVYTIESSAFPYTVELLEEFGQNDGFTQLNRYFSLLSNMADVTQFLKTFANSIHFLSQKCSKYFMPLKDKLLESLASISDAEIKKIEFHKSNTPIGPIESIISFQKIVHHFNQDNRQQKLIQLEHFNLLYRVLKVSNYNGRMFALNEIIHLLQQAKNEAGSTQDQTKLSCEDLASWAKQRNLLPALLHDSLHLTQYVERVSKVIQFMIFQNVFRDEEIDVLWQSKRGAHPAIVSNIHDLVADIAFELSEAQINYMFKLFLDTWTSQDSQTKDREILLSLVYKLAKGSLTDKVIELLWEMGSRPVSTDLMNDTLSNIVSIIKQMDQNANLNHIRGGNTRRKFDLMRKLIIQLHNEETEPSAHIPIMKLFELVGNLFDETVDPDSLSSLHASTSANVDENAFEDETNLDRKTILKRLEYEFKSETKQEFRIYFVRTHLIGYLNRSTNSFEADHRNEIESRLNFIRYLLREEQTFLRYEDAKEIWNELIVKSRSPIENQIGFEWFTSLMGDEPDLQEQDIDIFFIENILQYPTSQLTQIVITCFSRFFSHILNITIKSDQSTDNPVQLGLNYMWTALTSSHLSNLHCEDTIAPNIIQIIKDTYLSKHHSSTYASHNEFFDECVHRLNPFQETLSIIKTTEADQGRLIAVKIRRVLDVLRNYVEHWPYLRSTSDQFPLDQSWRGRQQTYRVQVNNKTLEIKFHDNATIGQLASEVQVHPALNPALNSPSYQIQLYSDQNSSNQTLEDSVRIKHSLPSEHQINQNNGIQFFGRIIAVGDKTKLSSRVRPQPDKALAEYPDFISNLIKLYDLALHLDSKDLCSSIKQIFLILPANDSQLINAIKKQENFEPLFDSSSIASNWYNIMILRMVLLPSDAERVISQEPKLYSYFFSSNAPHVLLRLLCSPKVSENMEIRHIETRNSLIAGLTEICRFITLVIVKRDEIEILTKRQKAPMHQNTLTVLAALDNFVFHLAQTEAVKMKIKSYRPVQLDYHHFSGLIRMIWSLTKTFHNLDEMTHLYNMAFEMFVLFGVVRPISSLSHQEKSFCQDSNFLEFIVQMLLSPHQNIRYWTSTFLQVAYTRKYGHDVADPQVTLTLANHLNSNLQLRCHETPDNSEQYFTTLAFLMEELSFFDSNMTESLLRLKVAIQWIDSQIQKKEANDTLLRGYLSLSSTYVRALDPLDLESVSFDLIKLLNEIVFPASPNERKFSKIPTLTKTGSSEVVPSSPRKLGSPLCDTKDSAQAALQLLVDITNGSAGSLRQLSKYLLHNWHDQANLKDFNHYPSSQKKSKSGLVGLKNGGATCYMNAVTQQIFMIPSLRNSLLSVQLTNIGDGILNSNSSAEKEYRARIFNIFQGLMGHLGASEMHYFTPKLFWDNLKLSGAGINVREQQDAMEYYSQIVDTLDEAMKDHKQPSVMNQYLMGAFSDQKICKDCPHRYTREEQFSSISVDVKSQHSLEESLAQFVKGDLLDGENKYFCEECQIKVACLKRLCIGKLPPYICIQLKRFDYDWEREEAIKFNDYFQFPRQLDMRPYTVDGIDETDSAQQALYRLKGIVIHSGQASGGHYYSLIRDKGKWLKFDDCDVTEIELTDEELESQCFGGDQGEIWDNRRGNYRRGRRWWNAYLLFYESIDEDINESVNDISQGLSDMSVNSSNSESFCVPQVDRRHVPPVMPTHIRQEVEHLNASMRHQRMIFSQEFLDFHFNIIESNKIRLDDHINHYEHTTSTKYTLEPTEKAVIDQLLTLSGSFLFSIGFRISRHARKINIGPTSEKPNWYTLISEMMKRSPQSKIHFINQLNSENIRDLLLYCPESDARAVIQNLLIICLIGQRDSSAGSADQSEMFEAQERLLCAYLNLLEPDLKIDPHYVKEYFNVLYNYITRKKHNGIHLGVLNLLKKNILFDLVDIALENEKYFNRVYKSRADRAEMTSKLLASISILIRHCDLSQWRHPEMSRNIYEIRTEGVKQPEIDSRVYEYLADNDGQNFSEFLKLQRKNDQENQDESKHLLAFMLWDNRTLSEFLGKDIMWNILWAKKDQIGKFWFPVLREYLTVDDRFMQGRIKFMMVQVQADQYHGMLGYIEEKRRSTGENVHQKIYIIMKMLVYMLSDIAELRDFLFNPNNDYYQKYIGTLNWLKNIYKDSINEPTTKDISNETHNGYNLVRTESFCDLVRTGLSLVPDGLLLDEEDSTDQTSTSESITRTHTSD